MIDNQFSELAIQRALWDWINTVIPLYTTGDRTPGIPALVWHMQQMPRVATPLIMGRLSNIRKTSRDYLSQPREEVIDSVNMFAVQQSGTREFKLYLEYFGIDAIDNLSKIQTAADTIPGLSFLWDNGIAVIEPGEVVDMHEFLGTMPEERALLEIRMRTSNEIIIKSLDVIEKVTLLGVVNNGVDVTLDTITIDTITV
jgi:hypothetical protein